MKELVTSGAPIETITREVAISIVLEIQKALLASAEGLGVPVRELACTLVGVVVAPKSCLFLQIGDGVIVVADHDEPDAYDWVFWPDRGEYANMTRFVTDRDATENLLHELCLRVIDEVAVTTDGLQALVLDYRARAAHDRFFLPMMKVLRTQTSRGELHEISGKLATYLASARINQRTDDDKTLVLASRCTML